LASSDILRSELSRNKILGGLSRFGGKDFEEASERLKLEISDLWNISLTQNQAEKKVVER
jgi:hypothetical protein